MKARWLFVLLGVATGVLLALAGRLAWQRLPSEPPADAASPVADPARALPSGALPSRHPQDDAELRRALAAEFEARVLLEDEIAALREEIARLRDAAREVEAAERDARRRSLDEAELLGAGIDAQRARRLRERFDEFERQRLEILDRETEDGVLSDMGALELYVAEQKMRYEVGEEAYDAMLFAAGRSNRLVVSSVVGDSPAGEAGIEPGDVVLRYAGERVFAPLDLQRGTRGDAGETVEVELLRGGERLRVLVPGGWLGVTVEATSQRPSGG